MDSKQVLLTKLTGCIYRSTQVHTNEVLKKYELGSGTYLYLLTLYHNEGINQNYISKILDVDKAMSTRVIKRLLDQGYIYKEVDREDSRANKLYLTEKGKEIIPVIKEKLLIWNNIITSSLSEQQKDELINLLSIVVSDTKNYRNSQKAEG